jgi:hypothetical protein
MMMDTPFFTGQSRCAPTQGTARQLGTSAHAKSKDPVWIQGTAMESAPPLVNPFSQPVVLLSPQDTERDKLLLLSSVLAFGFVLMLSVSFTFWINLLHLGLLVATNLLSSRSTVLYQVWTRCRPFSMSGLDAVHPIPY